MLAVKGDLAGNVDVTDAIAVREAKRLLLVQEPRHAFDPSSGLSAVSGVDKSHTPRLRRGAVVLKRSVKNVHGYISRVETVVCEVLFYNVAHVTETDNEVFNAVSRINFHDMPQYGPSADLNHRLRPNTCFFCQSRAPTTG